MGKQKAQRKKLSKTLSKAFRKLKVEKPSQQQRREIGNYAAVGDAGSSLKLKKNHLPLTPPKRHARNERRKLKVQPNKDDQDFEQSRKSLNERNGVIEWKRNGKASVQFQAPVFQYQAPYERSVQQNLDEACRQIGHLNVGTIQQQGIYSSPQSTTTAPADSMLYQLPKEQDVSRSNRFALLQQDDDDDDQETTPKTGFSLAPASFMILSSNNNHVNTADSSRDCYVEPSSLPGPPLGNFAHDIDPDL
jgi:hypothetical protein